MSPSPLTILFMPESANETGPGARRERVATAATAAASQTASTWPSWCPAAAKPPPPLAREQQQHGGPHRKAGHVAVYVLDAAPGCGLGHTHHRKQLNG